MHTLCGHNCLVLNIMLKLLSCPWYFKLIYLCKRLYSNRLYSDFKTYPCFLVSINMSKQEEFTSSLFFYGKSRNKWLPDNMMLHGDMHSPLKLVFYQVNAIYVDMLNNWCSHVKNRWVAVICNTLKEIKLFRTVWLIWLLIRHIRHSDILSLTHTCRLEVWLCRSAEPCQIQIAKK